MAMNDDEMALVLRDLGGSLVGSPFTGAWQPARDRVVIGIGDAQVLLVPRGPHARLHTIASRPRNPAKPFSFQGALRAHLAGPLTRVEKTDGDRIADLWFGGKRLHLRLTGRSGGLWLLDGAVVLAAYDGPAPAALPPTAPQGPRRDPPRFAPEDGETWDIAARRWFGAEETRVRREDRRATIERNLRAHLARSRRLVDALHDDLDKASHAPRLRRMADALAARLHTIRRGTAHVSIEDLEDPAVVHEIELDPDRPAAWSLERLYARARRLDRVGDRVIEHLDEVEKRVVALEQALAALPEAPAEELDRLASLAPAAPARAPREGDGLPWTTWTGPGGERVLVGRNEKGNRRLTFQTAKGDDYWMHVRERPGAHVVLPMEKGRSPTLDHLLAGAQIALVAAKVPEGVAQDVQYTRIRNLRAIPGEIARVTVHDEKVLRVVREPSVLAGWTHD